MTEPRYIIEAADEYGSLDYDRTDNLDAAIKLAIQLAESGLKPLVIDSNEMVQVWPPCMKRRPLHFYVA